jgi:hypothetical protein
VNTDYGCEEIAEVIAAAITVEFTPEVAEQIVAEGTPERKQFEEDFSAGISALLGVDTERVKVTGISVLNTTATVRRQLAEAEEADEDGEEEGVQVVVDFVILPDPTTGTNDGAHGSVATVLVRELSAPGVAICPAACGACGAGSEFVASGGGTTSSCCQTADPDSACARSYSAAAGITQSDDQVADLLALLQEQPGTRTARVTLDGLSVASIPAGTDARRDLIALFEADMGALLGVGALRVRVVYIVADGDGAKVEFMILAEETAADVQYDVELLEEHLGSPLHPLGQPSPMIAGFPAVDLDYEGREGSKLGILLGIIVGCLAVVVAIGFAMRKRKNKIAGEAYKLGGDSQLGGKSAVFVPDENMFDVSDDETAAATMAAAAEDEEALAPPRLIPALNHPGDMPTAVGASSTLMLPGGVVPHSPFPIGENPLDLAPIVRRESVRNQRAEDVARTAGMMGP